MLQLLQAKNVHGRAINLVQIRTVEAGSAEASCSTVRERPKFYKRLESICSTPADNQTQADVSKQRASLMKCNKQDYHEAAKIAGLTIFNKFKLTVLSPKKEMPLNL